MVKYIIDKKDIEVVFSDCGVYVYVLLISEGSYLDLDFIKWFIGSGYNKQLLNNFLKILEWN